MKSKPKSIAKRDSGAIKEDVVTFFKARIKHLLQEEHIHYDIIDSLLVGEVGRVSSLVDRAHVLETKKDEAGFKESLEALSRVMNIAVKCEKSATN